MPRLSVVRVGDDGITLRTRADVAVDVVFDEQRIGSFWSVADTDRRGRERLWAWPAALRPHLTGPTRLTLREHTSGQTWFEEEVRLGRGEERISVSDKHGNPLGLDKSFKLMRLFESRTAEHLAPLLDSMDEVVAALQAAGVRPFLAYGTLLGAVREGGLIGHDSDADLGYVSTHTHPADVMLESFAVQRHLHDAGYQVARYSGCALKVFVLEGDGTRRGLDVFGGFMRDGHLYLMGEVGHPFRPEWVHPLTTATLEGREYPVPAQPEHLLEAMYGPSWRVPDPAYRFSTPEHASRRLNGWFRGTRVQRDAVWAPYYVKPGHRELEPMSELAAYVHAQEAPDVEVVDIGCGTGSDAFHLAREGRSAFGLDYVDRAFRGRERRAQRRGLPARYDYANLSELRSAVATGFDIGHGRAPRVVMARHLADATTEIGRRNLVRFARLALAGGGRFYVETLGRPGTAAGVLGLRPIEVERFKRTAERAGATVVEETWRPLEASPTEATGEADAEPARLCRLVLSWS